MYDEEFYVKNKNVRIKRIKTMYIIQHQKTCKHTLFVYIYCSSLKRLSARISILTIRKQCRLKRKEKTVKMRKKFITRIFRLLRSLAHNYDEIVFYFHVFILIGKWIQTVCFIRTVQVMKINRK